MDKTETNQVCQVMMNELGLSRENIREMAESIINDTITKHLKSISFDRMIREVVKGWVKESISYTLKSQIKKVLGNMPPNLWLGSLSN